MSDPHHPQQQSDLRAATELRGEYRPFLRRLPLALVVSSVAVSLLSIGLPNIAPDVEFMAASDSPIRLFFAVAGEMNLPTFLSVSIFLFAAAAHLVVAVIARGRTGVAFGVTAGLLVLLAFDDFTMLHERLDGLVELVGIDSSNSFGYLWVLPGAVVAAVVVAAFWRLARRLSEPARRDLLLGLLLFFGASFGLETVNGFLDNPRMSGPPLQIITHIEEITENLGVILILRAALRLLELKRGRTSLTLRLVEIVKWPGQELEETGHAATGGRVVSAISLRPLNRMARVIRVWFGRWSRPR